MHLNVIVYVVIIDLLAIMSPGPDFFMVLKNSVSVSHKAGFFTTIGVTLGSTIMFSLGIFGLGAILASSKILFNIIKVIGALYLAYMGLKSLISHSKITEPQLIVNNNSNSDIDKLKYFKRGLFTNITNPKALIFILSLATYVAAHGSIIPDGIFVIIGSAINTIIWFTLVSFIFGSVKVRRMFYKRQKTLDIVFGVILLYVASKIVSM